MATERTKRTLLGIACVLVILGSVSWIYFTEIRAPRHNVGLHQRIGQVMAEQTAALVGSKGQIVLVAIETGDQPELKTELDAFKAAIKKGGDIGIKEYLLDTKDQPKYGVGTGLSARRFVRIVNKNLKANVIVSFVGAPHWSDTEFGELNIDKMPKFIAESRASDRLAKLFDKKVLQVAIVSRFQFPAPGTRDPKTPQEWFIKRYQIVTPENDAELPKPE